MAVFLAMNLSKSARSDSGALQLQLKKEELIRIKFLLGIEEPRVIRRCNILNCLHRGYASGEIANILNIDPKTVTNVGHAYLELGLERALYDDERSGRPIDIDDRIRSRIVAMVCSNPPEGTYRWTLDLIVEEVSKREIVSEPISREAVRLILKEHDLKPWQEKMWCVADLNEEYITRMEDVLDVYERPYDESNPMVCVDEKPVALISDVKDRVTAQNPGEITKIDYEYKRGGSANVFCAVEPKRGLYFNKVTDTRNGTEFAWFLIGLNSFYKRAEKIVLVMDNLSVHSENVVKTALGEIEGAKLWSRFEVHYTPKHGSWLNQAEIAIGMYSRQCLGDGRVGSLDDLKSKTAAWNTRANERQQTIHWRFTKAKAKKSLQYVS